MSYRKSNNYCVGVNTISTIKHFDLQRKPSSTQFYFTLYCSSSVDLPINADMLLKKENKYLIKCNKCLHKFDKVEYFWKTIHYATSPQMQDKHWRCTKHDLKACKLIFLSQRISLWSKQVFSDVRLLLFDLHVVLTGCIVTAHFEKLRTLNFFFQIEFNFVPSQCSLKTIFLSALISAILTYTEKISKIKFCMARFKNFKDNYYFWI